MRIITFGLCLLLPMSRLFAQQPNLNQYHVGVGDANGKLQSSNAMLQFNSGQLTIGSLTDNYVIFNNSFGTSFFQYDLDGAFAWRTNGWARRMRLTDDGALKIGNAFNNGVDPGSSYKLQVDGNLFLMGSSLMSKDIDLRYSAPAFGTHNMTARNYYRLQQQTTSAPANSYHSAQENTFTVQNATLSGYQSNAQNNVVYLSNANYTDQGSAGHIWSVQTNTFFPDNASQVSKFINTYIRTQLEGGANQIGTYYSLFLEAPFSGPVSQIGNYWGMYQESSAAKNFFAGKVGIGTTNMTDNGYKLFVESGIRTRKVKVDVDTWSDYVFDKGYRLPGLAEVEAYIRAHRHLPGVASAKEVEAGGLDLGESQAVLLKKIEELTLYVIDLQKQVDALKKKQ